MDSKKIGISSTFTFANLDEVDIVVSDSELSESAKQEFREANIEIL